jgi:hypothetical protein
MPAFAASLDVGMVPFRNPQSGDLLGGISPIKLYEYLAAGTLVISAPMPDAETLRQRGVVEVARHASEIPSLLDAAETSARDAALVAARRRVAALHSWRARWLALDSAIARVRR